MLACHDFLFMLLKLTISLSCVTMIIITLLSISLLQHKFIFVHQGNCLSLSLAKLFHSLVSSYHQKYLLRQQREILKGLGLSDKELITSHAACRLNGYCGGYGKLEELEKELPRFNISSDVAERVRVITSRGSRW